MTEDLQAMLAKHRDLRQQLANAWNPFFAKFGSLRPVQLETIPLLLNRENLLVIAPTAGGKTEAYAAPTCELIIRHKWKPLSALIVTPTRALVNDLYARLERPAMEMGLRLGRKTADHSPGNVKEQHMLITTPESLESLMTFRKDVLENVQILILDEIHMLDGTPRGDQLRILIRRMSKFLAYKQSQGNRKGALQIIASSATVPDPKRLAHCYLGGTHQIVTVSGQRSIEASFALTDQASAITVLNDYLEQAEDVHKILVFARSREQVDLFALACERTDLKRFAIFAHHGSLSRTVREHAEEQFRQRPNAICFATSSLEVGIDIGDVDLVVCLSPPITISAFLQQIGRGCRRRKGITRVLCLADSDIEHTIFQSVVNQSRIGIPKGATPPFRRAVMVQQILAYLHQVPKNVRTRTQVAELFTLSESPVIDSTLASGIVDDMLRSNLLAKTKDSVTIGNAGWDIVKSARIYSTFSSTPSALTVIDTDTGRTLGGIDALPQQGKLVLGGKGLHITGSEGTKTIKVRQKALDAPPPLYSTRRAYYSYEVAYSVRKFLGIAEDTLSLLCQGEELIVFTFLGYTLNEFLRAGLRRAGCRIQGFNSFCIELGRTRRERVGELLRSAALNCIEGYVNEKDISLRGVDLGAFQRELSDGLQAQTYLDWIDKSFWSQWQTCISDTHEISLTDPLGQELLSLSATDR